MIAPDSKILCERFLNRPAAQGESANNEPEQHYERQVPPVLDRRNPWFIEHSKRQHDGKEQST
jgi:hypothetical protein